MAAEILTFPSDVAAWRRGADLAFSMLFDIEACDFDETALLDPESLEKIRGQRPQRNFVAAYLAKSRKLDPSSELAFAAILTDYIASAMHAGAPCLQNCRETYRRSPFASEPTVEVKAPQPLTLETEEA